MNVRKRDGDVGTMSTKNAVTKRVNGVTQAKGIKNCISSPSPAGLSAPKGAVNKPSKG